MRQRSDRHGSSAGQHRSSETREQMSRTPSASVRADLAIQYRTLRDEWFTETHAAASLALAVERYGVALDELTPAARRTLAAYLKETRH